MSSILRDSPEIIPAGGVANEFNQCGGAAGAVPSVSGNAGVDKKQKTRKFSIIEGENVPKKGRKEEFVTDLNGNEVPLVNKIKPSGKIVDQEMKTNKPKWAHYLKKWVAPEWVPKNIPTLPKSKVKERVKNQTSSNSNPLYAHIRSISSGKVLNSDVNSLFWVSAQRVAKFKTMPGNKILLI